MMYEVNIKENLEPSLEWLKAHHRLEYETEGVDLYMDLELSKHAAAWLLTITLVGLDGEFMNVTVSERTVKQIAAFLAKASS